MTSYITPPPSKAQAVLKNRSFVWGGCILLPFENSSYFLFAVPTPILPFSLLAVLSRPISPPPQTPIPVSWCFLKPTPLLWESLKQLVVMLYLPRFTESVYLRKVGPKWHFCTFKYKKHSFSQWDVWNRCVVTVTSSFRDHALVLTPGTSKNWTVTTEWPC